MYLLDTNICIYAIKGQYPILTETLRSMNTEDISISTITIGELEYGAAKSKWGQRTRHICQAFLANFSVVPFADSDARVWGEIRAELATMGTPIGAYDAMIAAQCLARNLTVVTHNTREFSRVRNLPIEDWTQ